MKNSKAMDKQIDRINKLMDGMSVEKLNKLNIVISFIVEASKIEVDEFMEYSRRDGVTSEMAVKWIKAKEENTSAADLYILEKQTYEQAKAVFV